MGVVRDLPLAAVSIGDDATFGDAARQLAGSGVPAIAILDPNGRVRGVFTQDALLRGLFPAYLGELHHTAFVDDDPDTLGERARRGAGATDLLRPVLDALSGLSTLHEIGIRHGDFTPENVLVGRSGVGVLIDLGCARPFGRTEQLAGTEGFLAPELLEAGVHVNFPHIPPQPGPKRPQGTPDVYCEAPVGPGSHRVQLAGQTGERVLEIKREVFFGTYPVNADHKLCDVSAGDAKDASRGGVK